MSKLAPFLVIGDSHVRSYSNNELFFPLFVGQGKDFCFVSENHAQNVNEKVNEILNNFNSEQKVILLFGEPDTRFYLGKGWTPWTVEGEDDLNQFELKIDESFNRYKNFLDKIRNKFSNKFFVSTVPYSERLNQNKLVNYFNYKLELYLKETDMYFIDIRSSIFDFNGNLKEGLMGDIVHYSNIVQPMVEEFLYSKNQISKSGYQVNPNWHNKYIQNDYVFNERFGCYIKNDLI